MKRVEVAEAAKQLAALLAEVRRGEEVVLTEAGEAVGRLVAATPKPQPGSFEALDAEVRAVHAEMRVQGVRPFNTDEIRSLIREGRRY